jgi:hypothetical protein
MSVDNGTGQIMHDYTYRNLTLSYSEGRVHTTWMLWVEDGSAESRLLADLWDIPTYHDGYGVWSSCVYA